MITVEDIGVVELAQLLQKDCLSDSPAHGSGTASSLTHFENACKVGNCSHKLFDMQHIHCAFDRSCLWDLPWWNVRSAVPSPQAAHRSWSNHSVNIDGI